MSMFGLIGKAVTAVGNAFSSIIPDAVGAIATDAVVGAASGALVGAATAAIKGDDIGDGALEGTMYGGAIGGLGGAAKQLFGETTTSLSKDLFDTSGLLSRSIDESSPQSYIASQQVDKNITSGGLFNFSNEEKGQMWAAGIEGAVDTYMTNEETESAEEIADKKIQAEKDRLTQKEQIRKDRIAANQPGEFKVTTPIIKRDKLASWWDKHLMKNKLQRIEEAQYA